MVVIGVIMFVSPIDDDTDFHLGVREVVMMDSINHTVFLRILDELPECHREQLSIENNYCGTSMLHSSRRYLWKRVDLVFT
jgi:hypothetical protein